MRPSSELSGKGTSRHRRRRARAAGAQLPRAIALGIVSFGCLFGCGQEEGEAPHVDDASSTAVVVAATEVPGIEVEGTSAATVASELRSGDLATLERRLAAITALEVADPASGEPLAAAAFDGLSSADSELTERLINWHDKSGGSPYAALALALHYNRLAWRARGYRYAGETPGSAFVDFERWRDKALPLTHAAVEAEPQLVEGWVLLIGLNLGDPNTCSAVASKGLQGLPASWRIRSTLMNCLRPRWGGTYEAMDEVAREARRYEARNPRLRWLAGYVAQDRANLALHDEDYELGRRWVDEALARGGPAPIIVREEARVLRAERQLSRALEVLDEGLREWPDDRDMLVRRMSVLSRLGRDEEARETLDRLEAIDPDDENVGEWQRYFGREARKVCESLSRKKLVELAIDRCTEALEIDPRDEHSRYWLARAYMHGGRYEDATKELEAVLKADPRHRDAIVNLDWLYGRKEEWQKVAGLWDAYLELEPGDARAWLERAGTRRRLGRGAEACADLERSCALGNGEACRYRGRDC